MPEEGPLETGTEMLHMKVWCNQVCPDYLIAHEYIHAYTIFVSIRGWLFAFPYTMLNHDILNTSLISISLIRLCGYYCVLCGYYSRVPFISLESLQTLLMAGIKYV